MHKTNQPQTTNNPKGRDAAIRIVCNGEAIKTETIDGVTYYSTTRRGVAYTAYQASSGHWFVSTKRLALGQFSTGGGKYYPGLAALGEGCKAFAALPALLSMTTR